MIDQFLEKGWAKIGPVLSDQELSVLRARAEDMMLGRVRYDGLFYQKDTSTGRYEDLEFGRFWQGPSLEYRKLEKLELDPEYRKLIHHPRFEPIARALISGGIAIYRAVLFNKPANGGTVLPWHQDAGSMWGLDRDPVLQIWTALDDSSPESGCVEVLEGSHHQGLATRLGGMVPEEIVARGIDESRIIPIVARAGESFLIHSLVWHRSGVNKTPSPRRAISVSYISAETKCLRKRRAPRTFYGVWG